jgi:hypothetical protein
VVATVGLAFWGWGHLPPVIPTHFGLNGLPNRWGSRNEVWWIAGFVVLFYVGLSVVARFPKSFNLPVRSNDPRRASWEQLAVGMLGWLKMEFCWTFVCLMGILIHSGESGSSRLSVWFPVIAIAAVFATILTFFFLGTRLKE